MSDPTHSNNNSDTSRKKFGFFTKFIIFILILYILFSVWSYFSLKQIQNSALTSFTKATSTITKQNTKIDSLEMTTFYDVTKVINFALDNPPGYVSPFAMSADTVVITAGIGNIKGSKDPVIAVDNVTINNAVFNYDINTSNQTNLYTIQDNIIRTLAPNPSFNPTAILSSANKPMVSLNYSGTNFLLGYVKMINTTVNIYSNNNYIKKITIPNIRLNYGTVKQPMNYGEAMLAGTLQLIEILDNNVNNPN